MRPFSASCFKYHLNADGSEVDQACGRFSLELRMSAFSFVPETSMQLNDSLFPTLLDSTIPKLVHSQPFISGSGTASCLLLGPKPNRHPCFLPLASFNQPIDKSSPLLVKYV